MTRVAQLALLVAALGVGFWLGQRESQGPATLPDPPPANGRATVERLEHESPGPTRGREPVTAPDSGTTTLALEQRVRELEAEVDRLRAELRAARSADEPDSAEAIHAALRELDPNDPLAISVRTKRQRQRLEQLLERFPNDAGAVQALAQLSGSWIAEDPTRALEVLELHAKRVGMPAWRQDGLAANALKFGDRIPEADLAYQRVIDSPEAPEHERWNARFSAAYLYMREGQYDEARARFEALIALGGADPPASIRDTIEGAKHQLELIARYASER